MGVLVLSVTCAEGHLPVFVCPSAFDQVESDEFLSLRKTIAAAGWLVAIHFNVGTAVIRFMARSQDHSSIHSALSMPNAPHQLMEAVKFAVRYTKSIVAKRDDLSFAVGVSIELLCGQKKGICSTNYIVHFNSRLLP